MKGTNAIIETMLKQGTDVTFGYPGGGVIPLYDTFLDYEDKLRNILVRHEQAAAHAADAFGRVTGKPGVCIATSGPGATNLVTGIMTAYMDSSPMIALGGQVGVNLLGNDAFQESDMYGITLPITKHNFQIRKPDNCAPVLMKAYKIASEGRPGPVYIDLTKDAQVGEVKKSLPKQVDIPSYQPTYKGHIHQLKRAAEMIMNAERPVFLVGGGIITSNASGELRQLVELVHAPITTTIMGKGAFPENHPLSLGTCGMHGRKVSNYAVINCDLLIAIGCRFSDRITGNLKTYAENCSIIHIDLDPAEIGKNVKVKLPIVGDAKHVIIDLIKAIKGLGKKGKETEWSKRMKEFAEICNCNIDHDSTPIKPEKVMHEIRKATKPEDIICTGVGQHQMYSAHFLRRTLPRTFITSGGAGTMGFGLPAAMGAKIAKPEANVFDIDGDGCFQMNIQELGTLKDENIKVTPIIMNNQYLGMVRQWLEIYFDKRYSQVWIGDNPDFIKVANAYNLEGEHVVKASELGQAIQKSIKHDETYVVNVKVEPETNILPMLPPGGNLKDAFGGCMVAPGKFF